MTKYIKSYSQVNESIGRGSVVLIKGKPEGGKKKLYAAHVLGTAEISRGATMLFLSDDFYRIKEEDGKLKALKISYRSEDSLKSVLNLKSAGKISVVKNNNKTPFHWKTTKHSHVQSALKEVESDLLSDNYLLESENNDNAERFKKWEEFSTKVATKAINTVFLGNKQIDVLNYRIDEGVTETALDRAEFDDRYSEVKVEWEMTCTVRLRSKEFDPYLQYFEYESREAEVSFAFISQIDVVFDHDPGDYWTAPYTETDIGDVNTKLSDIYIDGTTESLKDPELLELVKKTDDIIETFLEDQLKELVANNLRNQLILKKED